MIYLSNYNIKVFGYLSTFVEFQMNLCQESAVDERLIIQFN